MWTVVAQGGKVRVSYSTRGPLLDNIAGDITLTLSAPHAMELYRAIEDGRTELITNNVTVKDRYLVIEVARNVDAVRLSVPLTGFPQYVLEAAAREAGA